MSKNSHNRRIVEGFLWVSFFVFLGKLAGAGKEMVIAWRYGVGATVDAYVLIFNLINWPVAVWFSVLTVVLVPLLARIKHEDAGSLRHFVSELMGLSIAMGIALALVMNLGMAWLFAYGSTVLAPDTQAQAHAMVTPLSVLLPLGLVTGMLSAWTMAHGRHRNTLLEVLPSLVLMIVLLLPAGMVPTPLAWGSVAGWAMQTLLLGWPLWRKDGPGMPVFAFKSPVWRHFWKGVGIMIVGQTFTSMTIIIDQFFAARLGTGSISILSYATRLTDLIMGLGAMAISRATLPVFSELSLHENGTDVQKLATRWAAIMFVVGLGTLGVAWALAPWGVALLFQRGSFGLNDTAEVAGAFRHLAFQVPFYFASLVLIARFAAMRKYRIVAAGGAINLVVKSTLLYLLTPLYGLVGVYLSTVIMYIFALFFFLFLHRRIAVPAQA